MHRACHLVDAQLCLWSLVDQMTPLRIVFQRAQIDLYWFICVLLLSPFVSEDTFSPFVSKDTFISLVWGLASATAQEFQDPVQRCFCVLPRRTFLFVETDNSHGSTTVGVWRTLNFSWGRRKGSTRLAV